jgi:hypothetical protein
MISMQFLHQQDRGALSGMVPATTGSEPRVASLVVEISHNP